MNSFHCLRKSMANKGVLRGALGAILLVGVSGGALQAQTASVAPGQQPVAQDPLYVPPSHVDMKMDSQRVEKFVAKNVSEVERRLHGLKVTPPEDMASADTSPYTSTLRDMQETQRQILVLDKKKELAEKSVELWNILYNPEEDEAAGMRDDNDPDSLEEAAPVAQPSAPPEQSTGADAAEEVAPVASPAPSKAPEPRRERDLSISEHVGPMPVIVSILGTGNNIKATLLVPYAGEFEVTEGMRLPNGMRVDKVTSTGVLVRDAAGNRYPLSFGDSVPSQPASKQTSDSSQSSGVLMPGGGLMF